MYSLEALRSAESSAAGPQGVAVMSPARTVLPQSTSKLFSSILDATRRAGRLTGESAVRPEGRSEPPEGRAVEPDEKAETTADETREPARKPRAESRRADRPSREDSTPNEVEAVNDAPPPAEPANDVRPEDAPPRESTDGDASGDESTSESTPGATAMPLLLIGGGATFAIASVPMPGVAGSPYATTPSTIGSPASATAPQSDAAGASTPVAGAMPLPAGMTAAAPTVQGAASTTSSPNTESTPKGEQPATSAKASPTNHGFATALHAARSANVRGAGIASGTTSATGTTRLDEPGSIRELAQVVRTASRGGQSTMLLRLDPPELGALRIDVRMQHDVLTLRMEAHSQAGHDALQGRLAELKTALEQQGIQVGTIEIELKPPSAPGGSNGSDAQAGGQQAGDGASQHSHGSAHDAHEGSAQRPFTWREPDAADAVETMPAIAASLGAAAAGLDLVA